MQANAAVRTRVTAIGEGPAPVLGSVLGVVVVVEVGVEVGVDVVGAAGVVGVTTGTVVLAEAELPELVLPLPELLEVLLPVADPLAVPAFPFGSHVGTPL